uniref:interferon-induced GTP-binding protein Mx1-like isoform X1 n=1 Tax=Myodes glareolus TaxID=447135 RepID=UPI0020209102|nr:interferon-induced GTP-binding protein Mx1-like isoform X1 [Myodes glareolus]XP_048278516.1 interferon-induced GTP-binding protein Mx1-like isoform X1 [Myodes glareolus]XP_048278517.1 interferon-induced GTP-binding protein Mx1-like isoform X1 [Myodes glareolus]XP_048278518.1 interferon-induced GTP-binding protein Mx1-like isoform X1 [Myodes glareolus]XP_048278519.1 interferon-induced GTP-binding protein Mx1-like isoform X1 [Myodes glareolus]
MSSSQKAHQKELTSASNHLEPQKYSDASTDSQATDPVNNLCSQYEEKVRPCLDLIDSLRALGVEQDLALPAIAVIGDQSSGKSSVLEALSGVALPRGSGIVTRCPLVLKLRKLEPGEEWRGKVIYNNMEVELSDPSQVEEAINKAQNFVAGVGLEISDKLISLDVSSPNVPDLTLIDLPGITRVAVGNQPADIGRQIKKLIKTYIQKQETINLVVVPSNVDIATTEALSMAKEVDPEGDRTIGILTKPDLVDRGAEDKVVDVMRNLVFQLKKGYMIVKCRGQQDIQKRMNLAEALKMEQAFFEEHPHFRVLLEDGKATVPRLAERLTTELIAHICKSLPLLENQIKESYQSAVEELQKYGTEIPEDDSSRTFFLIDKINAFNKDITAMVQAQETVSEGDSRLFTNLRNEFLNWNNYIEKHFKTSSAEIYSQIKVFENQYRGRELPGFVNYMTFENIIKKQIKVLEEPAVDMLHKVTDMVRKAFISVSSNNFGDFFNLFSAAKSKIEDIRLKQEKTAEQLIRLHFQMEQIVYCQDQVYKGALEEVRENEAEKEKNKVSNSNTFRCNSQPPQKDLSVTEMTQHLNAYYQECGRSIGRQIPLIIQYFTLQTFGKEIEKSMLQLLQDKVHCSRLLAERKATTERRKFLKRRLSRLDQARHKLAKFSYE